MSALANEHGAINLSQGFPDFPLDGRLFDLVHKYMHAGKNQYAPMPGALELREAVCNKIMSLYGVQYSSDTEITITAGATQAIYSAIAATVHEGDEVILFTPAYDCYAPAIKLHGGKPVYIQLKTPDFSIDWSEVKKMVNRRTRMIIINTPHNPSGTILSKNDMLELDKLTANSDILVLSDEVYEHVIFDGEAHQSACLFPGLRERSLIVASFGKTFHTTGWKVGYCLAPEHLMEEFRKSHQFIVFTVNTPVQLALAEYMQDESTYNCIATFYQKKRDVFLDLLKDSPFEITPSKGTYFQLLNYRNISTDSDVELAKRWTEELKVASIPISVFYHNPTDNHFLRFCFAKQDETLEQAAEILRRV